jgi:hypothetical protein
MATKTEIANAALGRIGQARILDIDENTPAAEHCRRMWDIERDALLRKYAWNFAIGRATLSKLVSAPAFGWSAQFVLPADFIRVIAINEMIAGMGETEFEVEGGLILLDSEEAHLKYVRRVEDCTRWDALFCRGYAIFLAAAVMPSLATSPELAVALERAAVDFEREAFSSDAVESKPLVRFAHERSGWLDVRGGFGTQMIRVSGAGVSSGVTGTVVADSQGIEWLKVSRAGQPDLYAQLFNSIP